MFGWVIWGCSLQRHRQGCVQVWWKVTFGATPWTRHGCWRPWKLSAHLYQREGVCVTFSLLQSVRFVYLSFLWARWGQETAFSWFNSQLGLCLRDSKNGLVSVGAASAGDALYACSLKLELWSLWISLWSLLFPLFFLFVFVAGWIVAGENGNSQSDQFPLVLLWLRFSPLVASCWVFFFLYPQVLSPRHRLKPEIIRSLSLLHLSLCHTFSNTFTFGNLDW